MLKTAKGTLGVDGDNMEHILKLQQEAYRRDGPSSLRQRTEWLDRLIGILVDNKTVIADTVCEDFGNRSRDLTLIADVLGSINSLRFARDNLSSWMKPELHEGMFPDAVARVEYRPLGVVGMLSPWNFPVNLTFAPLAGIIAAGNRCIIKPSELTPMTSNLIASMIRSAFAEDEIAVVLGGPDLAAAFSSLPFDHLLYTGSTAVGRSVMRAAAENLVPVTLELGGKSPVIIGVDASVEDAAARIMTIKTLNAGQICLAPDYVLIPADSLQGFIDSATRAVGEMYASFTGNGDYTAIINERHYERLQGYLTDAEAGGARVVSINPANETFAGMNMYILPPTLVIEPAKDSKVMQEEVFGPILPICTYRTIDEAIDFINSRPSPLALYYFGNDAVETEQVLNHTRSGGVTINDIMTHAFAETMPFGGVGLSGMGSYHGKSGFERFSHARSIYFQSRRPEAEYALRAPFGAPMHDFLEAAIIR